jgi:hypothetical protein
MKKIIVFLLAFLLCVSFVACGESADTQPSQPNQGSQATKPTNPSESECFHNWKNASCVAPKTCSICGETEGEIGEHKWQEASCNYPKYCTRCGATEGTYGHTWSEQTCTSPKTCTTCGKTESTASHTWVDATCTAPKTCSICGTTSGKVAEHQFEETSRIEPASNQNGSVTYTCSVCGAIDTKILEATGSIGLEYERNSDGTYTVIGLGTCTDSQVVIPKYYEGAKVTAIGRRAFYDCHTIEEITIPETISEIGQQIFYKCSALHTV